MFKCQHFFEFHGGGATFGHFIVRYHVVVYEPSIDILVPISYRKLALLLLVA